MKFAVKAVIGGRARVGRGEARISGMLHLGPNPIETPALLLSTRKGLLLFISPDLLPCLPRPDSHLLQFSPPHFLDGPCPKTISSIGGLHQMLGLHEYGFVAVARDSVQSLPEFDSTDKFGASFETPCGRRLVHRILLSLSLLYVLVLYLQVKPVEYMEMISSMRPNLRTTLADEVPAWVSDKRNKTSVDRTVKWLDECITLSPAGGTDFGSIVGGSIIEERQRCAQEVAKRNVSGYWIGGFGLAESMDDRSPLLNAVTDNLPEERPRLICGLGLTEEVLQGIAAGVGTFLTRRGFALIFPLNGMKTSDIGSDGTKINLRATMYRHKTHHYLGFFRSIRYAIKEGKFEEFQNMFVQSRRSSCIPE
ncbi:hypothetical protein QYF36_002822 [Acer negundo]|nr:hypothetical protein QYF36_002822 [Acer negundo]